MLSNEPNINLIIDGIIGHRSLSALNRVNGKYGGYESIIMGLSVKRGEHYFEILKNETQRVFFRGWFRRLAETTQISLEYK